VKRIRTFALITAFLAATLFSPSAEAGRVIDPSTQKIGLLFTENMELTSMTSVIYGRSDYSSSLNYKMCKSATDPICDAATEMMIIQFFALCEKASDVNCIEEIWARGADNKKISATYQRHLPNSGLGDFAGEPKMNLPASKGTGFVVKIPGVTHKGGNDEYLVALRNQTTIFKKAGESATNHTIGVQGLVGGISPFEIVRGEFRSVKVVDGYGSDGGVRVTPNGDSCFATDDGICAATRDFPSEYRFGLSMRLSERINGWFHGRIANPTITSAAGPSSWNISFEAKPVRVATLDFTVPTAEVDKAARDMIFNGEEWGVSGNSEGTRIVAGLDEERSQTLLKLFVPNFKDKATRTNEYWTFKTLSGFRDDSIYRCSKDFGALAGVVTTNSLLYSAGPPSFNAAESSLDYKVSSPHFEASGQEAVGSYDLLLRSDVARCIYGFTEAPIKATLEVLGADGTTKVATTVINEKDGWLTMSASGFGFSAPLVRAKLSQEKVESKPTPTPTSTATATATPSPSPTLTPTKAVIAANSKKTITCSRGASVKKVVAVNPKCPKGWKKRA
jgi:hypothetical protein